jgi:hypothetical protein
MYEYMHIDFEIGYEGRTYFMYVARANVVQVRINRSVACIR